MEIDETDDPGKYIIEVANKADNKIEDVDNTNDPSTDIIDKIDKIDKINKIDI